QHVFPQDGGRKAAGKAGGCVHVCILSKTKLALIWILSDKNPNNQTLSTTKMHIQTVCPGTGSRA
ncbi:MAG: hypothetical protein VW687_12550, partial [Curvibacter sp.]